MVRYLVKFSKESSIKFIGHLDLMRTIQRTARRSGLPVQYSNGFNPHINMSIAQPLSVGVYSCGEYMDISFEEEVPLEDIKNEFNSNAPSGVRILAVKKIEDIPNTKIYKSMAEIKAARYRIKIKYKDTSLLCEDIENLEKMDEWPAIRKSKKKENEIDIKKFINNISYKIDENVLLINTVISCGSSENLSARLLVDFIRKGTKNADMDAFVDIMREEMYGKVEDKILPLLELV